MCLFQHAHVACAACPCSSRSGSWRSWRSWCSWRRSGRRQRAAARAQAQEERGERQRQEGESQRPCAVGAGLHHNSISTSMVCGFSCGWSAGEHMTYQKQPHDRRRGPTAAVQKRFQLTRAHSGSTFTICNHAFYLHHRPARRRPRRGKGQAGEWQPPCLSPVT
jgi:hypothetical protein